MYTAATIMKTELVKATKDTPIYDAIGLMVERNITGLPVVDEDNKLIGIISEKDVLKLLYDMEDRDVTVKEFMTPNVISFEQDTPLKAICASFKQNAFRRVPILDNNKRLIGIISRKDMLAFIGELRKLKDTDESIADLGVDHE